MKEIDKLRKENSLLKTKVNNLLNEIISKNQYINKLEGMLFSGGKW